MKSIQNADIFYIVNSKIETYIYSVGIISTLCKHQKAVSVKFYISTFNFLPSLICNDCMLYAYITLGK